MRSLQDWICNRHNMAMSPNQPSYCSTFLQNTRILYFIIAMIRKVWKDTMLVWWYKVIVKMLRFESEVTKSIILWFHKHFPHMPVDTHVRFHIPIFVSSLYLLGLWLLPSFFGTCVLFLYSSVAMFNISHSSYIDPQVWNIKWYKTPSSHRPCFRSLTFLVILHKMYSCTFFAWLT